LSDFSDYIVYVDESGDHSLTSIDPQYPVFALSFCVVRKDEYATSVVPAMQAFKFKYWGHDAVVLHEHEIRKSKNDFTLLLTDASLRAAFYDDLNAMMENAPVAIIACVVDKVQYASECSAPPDPYDIALNICMRSLHGFLIQRGQAGRQVHIIFEKRGKKEDADLAQTFDRVVMETVSASRPQVHAPMTRYTARFVSKLVNSTGLQLADLTARPIALGYLRPEQKNRALDIIAAKDGGVTYLP
jgi:hypothetical protein